MKNKFRILLGLSAAVGAFLVMSCCASPDSSEFSSESLPEQKYSISFDTKGGEIVSSVFPDGKEPVALPVPAWEGYDFAGWYYDDMTYEKPCGEDLGSSALDKNVVVYAKWNPRTETELSVVQREASRPVVNVHYDFKGADVSGYTDFKIEFFYGDRLLSSVSADKELSITQTVCYGNIGVEMTARSDRLGRVTLAETSVGIWAEEYNFACLNATYPVIDFSLSLYSRSGETREAFLGKSQPVMADAPTFVSLERAKGYDWSRLPDRVYPLPNAPANEVVEGYFHKHGALMAEYIKELYEIHPDSFFHFYCVDNYPELILKFFDYQGIQNYTATMITDGTGTVSYFNKMFGGADAKTEYDKMAKEWLRVKEAAKNGDENFLKGVYQGFDGEVSVLANYPFVIASVEKNVSWWCSRADLFINNTQSEFIKDLVNGTNVSGENTEGIKLNVVYPGISNMLSALSEADRESFKRLYKFDGEYFDEAYKNGQKVLLVLGTKVENLEELKSYIDLLKAYYKDEYRIYYKGHPGAPTELDPDKQSLLDSLEVTDVNSSIAAELILFYCPDIYLVGYQSTTFRSAQPERILALFAMTKSRWKELESMQGYKAKLYFSVQRDETGKMTCKIESDEDESYAVFDPVTGKFEIFEDEKKRNGE